MWPDIRESNLAGLPAALFGFLPGLGAGAVGGWFFASWLSGMIPSGRRLVEDQTRPT
jgi:hypothetical protein